MTHKFAPGIYMREVSVPAGDFVIGKKHLHSTLNILVKGRVSVVAGGGVMPLTAPYSFVSGPGVRKAVYVHEDMTWVCFHPTEETDLEKIEQLFIDSSPQALEEEAKLREQFTSLYKKELHELG